MDDVSQLIFGGIVIAPIITGLVEVAKSVGLKSKYAPIVAISAGLLIALVAKASEVTDGSWLFYVIVGIKAGFEAIGWHQVGSKTVEMVNAGSVENSDNTKSDKME